MEQFSYNFSIGKIQPKSLFGNTQLLSHFEANATTLMLSAYLSVNDILKNKVLSIFTAKYEKSKSSQAAKMYIQQSILL